VSGGAPAVPLQVPDAAPPAFTMVGGPGMSCEGDSCAVPGATDAADTAEPVSAE
jgi:hypothetical protein